jgi:hypothetical protein
MLNIFGRKHEVNHRMSKRELGEIYGEAESCYGLYDPNSSTIYIAMDQDESEKEKTILHEILEAIKSLFQLDHVKEDDILLIEQGMHYTLTNAGVDLSKLRNCLLTESE